MRGLQNEILIEKSYAVLQRQKLIWNTIHRDEIKNKMIVIHIPYAVDGKIQRLMCDYVLPRCRKEFNEIRQNMGETTYQGIMVRYEDGRRF